MSDFEYFFSFFGLLLGLTVAQVATKFADAIDAREGQPMGLLSPLLACFVLLDITSFWLFAWSFRDTIRVTWTLIFSSLFIAMAYFLSASLIFPRTQGWKTLDDHYWARKRVVLGGVVLANLAVLVMSLTRQIPLLSDVWFFVYQMGYYVPITVLLLSRRRKLDILLLVYLIFYYFLVSSGLTPASVWGNNVGINGTVEIN